MNPADSLPERPTRVRWLILGLACTTSWLLYLQRYSWGVIKPSLKSEHPEWTTEDLGWLDSVFQLSYTLGQVPGGLAGDILGPRAILSLLMVLWSAALLLLGMSHGYRTMATFQGTFGLAQAGCYPNLGKVTRSWFPLSIRTTVQGVVGTLSGRAGGACASFLIAYVLMGQLHLPWRQALVAIGVAGMIFALLFWLLFRNSPADHPWANQAEQEAIDVGTVPIKRGVKPRLHLNFANTCTLVMLAVYAFLSTFADQLYVYWIPTFLREARGLDNLEMGKYAGLPLLGGAIGGTVGGVLNDAMIRATGSRRLGRSGVAFTGKFLAGVLIALSVAVPDGRWVMVVLLACKFFGDWSLPTQWGTTTDIAGPAAGTVFGVVNMVGAAAGIVAGPLMGRIIGEDHGWDKLFFTVAGVYVLSACCWLFIDCTRQLVVEQEQPGA